MATVKLPPGLVVRGPSYYIRDQRGGRDRWICLGRELDLALERYRDFRRGSPLPTAIPLSSLAAQWLAVYIPVHRNEKGVQLATDRVTQFLVPELGTRRTNSLHGDDVRAYRLALERRGLSPQTVAHILSDLRCLLRWAEDARLLVRSPFPRGVMPRIQERPPDRLTDGEVAALVKCPDPFGYIARLAVSTGLRWGELARAGTRDIHCGTLTVHQTKSGKLRRVPLSPAILAELEGRVGRLLPFGAKSLGYVTRQLLEDSKVERFHFHQFRHTYACRWIEAGGSLEALQKALGHSSIRVTQRYAQLSDEWVMQEAMKVWRGNGSRTAEIDDPVEMA